jgi:hypothetical protein
MKFLAHKAEGQMLSEKKKLNISQGLFVAQFPAMSHAQPPPKKNNEDHQADTLEAQRYARGLGFVKHDRMTKQC